MTTTPPDQPDREPEEKDWDFEKSAFNTPNINSMGMDMPAESDDPIVRESSTIKRFDEPDHRELDIVCICGSSRFADIAAVEQWEYAKRGILALSMHLLPDWYWEQHNIELPDGGHGAEAEGVADILDELHLRKIDMANRILVINRDGYIGERTRFEIEYATKLGKPVEYLEETND